MRGNQKIVEFENIVIPTGSIHCEKLKKLVNELNNEQTVSLQRDKMLKANCTGS